MLKQPVPSLSRWIAGSAIVVTLLLSTGVAAWAAQPHRVVSDDAAAVAPPAPPAPPEAPAAPPAPPAPPAPTDASAGVAPRPPPEPPTPPSPAPPAVAPAPPAHRTPAPVYPVAAAAQRIGGKVVLLIDIDAEGRATAVEVERSEPAGVFDKAAVDAAMRWTFSPERKDGKPVPSRVRVPVEFKPDPPAPPAPPSLTS